MANYVELTGYLNKEETIHTLSNNKLKNTFVLVADEPYPGYHYHKIDARYLEKNTTVFLITSKRYTWESIIRATTHINLFLEESIDASYASLSLFNVPHYAIRIMGLKNKNLLETIQKAFQDEGFVFMRNKRFSKPRATFFKVKRFFNIEKFDEGIYTDDEGMHYILIEKKIEWELFRKMTRDVKSNVKNNNYDVISGAFYWKHSLVDFIRVFKPDGGKELFKELKEKYQKQIRKYF